MIYIILVILIIFVIILYNIIIKHYNKIKEAYSSLDVYLKKRYDLIPNLIECVKGYSSYESELLEKVLIIRNNNLNIDLVNNTILSFENYPLLKADKVFINLQKSLYDLEEQISAARRNYNSCVNYYNSFIQLFPINLIASLFKFKKVEFYKFDKDNR